MNVAELRAALADLPDDMMVVVRGYEDGVNEVTSLERTKVALNYYSESWYGRHNEFYNDEEAANYEGAKAEAVHLIGG